MNKWNQIAAALIVGCIVAALLFFVVGAVIVLLPVILVVLAVMLMLGSIRFHRIVRTTPVPPETPHDDVPPSEDVIDVTAQEVPENHTLSSENKQGE